MSMAQTKTSRQIHGNVDSNAHKFGQSDTTTGVNKANDYGNISSFNTSVLSQGRSRLQDIWEYVSSPIYNVISPILNFVGTWTSSIFDATKVYWDAYPAIRAFTYMWIALTAIPNLIFLVYAVISFSVVGGLALLGVTLIEGGVLGFGMLFLGPVLFFSGLAALIGTSIFTALLYSLRATSITLGTAQQMSGMNTGIIGNAFNVAKNTSAMTADLATKAESFITDYYALLKVPPTSSFETILSSYQSQALKLHPDVHPSDNVTTATFNLINEAYYVLSDTQRRSAYDKARALNNTSSSTNNSAIQSTMQNILGLHHTNMMDIFDNVFEPMIADEMRHHLNQSNGGGGMWGMLGSVSGSILGFIFANIPGAVAGGVLGYKAGGVRDRTGQSIMDSFRNLSSDQRHTILTSLARKLIF